MQELQLPPPPWLPVVAKPRQPPSESKQVLETKKAHPYGFLSLAASGIHQMIDKQESEPQTAQDLKDAVDHADVAWLAKFLAQKTLAYRSLAQLVTPGDRFYAMYEMIHGKWTRLFLGPDEDKHVFRSSQEEAGEFRMLLQQVVKCMRILEIVQCPHVFFRQDLSTALLRPSSGNPQVEILVIEQSTPVGAATLIDWLNCFKDHLRLVKLKTGDTFDMDLLTRLAGQHKAGTGVQWWTMRGACLFISMGRSLSTEELGAMKRTWITAQAEWHAPKQLLLVRILPVAGLSSHVNCELEDIATEMLRPKVNRSPLVTQFTCTIRIFQTLERLELRWFANGISPFATRIRMRAQNDPDGTRWDDEEVVRIEIDYNEPLLPSLKERAIRGRRQREKSKLQQPKALVLDLKRVCNLSWYFSRLADDPSLHEVASLSELQFLQGLPYVSLCKALKILQQYKLLSAEDTLLVLFAGGQLNGLSCEGLVRYYEKIGFHVTAESPQEYAREVADVHINMHGLVDEVLAVCASKEVDLRSKRWDELVKNQVIEGPMLTGNPISREEKKKNQDALDKVLQALLVAKDDKGEPSAELNNYKEAIEWLRTTVVQHQLSACLSEKNLPTAEEIETLIDTCQDKRFVVGISPRYVDAKTHEPRGSRAWILDRTTHPPLLETFTIPSFEATWEHNPIAKVRTARRTPVHFKWIFLKDLQQNITDQIEAKFAALFIHLRLLQPDVPDQALALSMVNSLEWSDIDKRLARYPAPLSQSYRQLNALGVFPKAEGKKAEEKTQHGEILWPKLIEEGEDPADWFDDPTGALDWLELLAASRDDLDVIRKLPSTVLELHQVIQKDARVREGGNPPKRFLISMDEKSPTVWVLNRHERRFCLFSPADAHPVDLLLDAYIKESQLYKLVTLGSALVPDLIRKSMTMQDDIRACALFVHLCVLNPEKEGHTIVDSLFEGDVSQVRDRLERYPASLSEERGWGSDEEPDYGRE